MKIRCARCRELKPANMFRTDRSHKSGVASSCKSCDRIWKQERVRLRLCIRCGSLAKAGYTRCRACLAMDRKHSLNYRKKYPQEIRARSALRYRRTRERRLATHREWRARNADYLRRYQRRYRRLRARRDPLFNLVCRLRDRLRHACSNSGLRKPSTLSALGCSPEELKKHLEAQFKPGMSWDGQKNHGRRQWHIDHIIPLHLAARLGREGLEKASHFSNLRPLWALENGRRNCERTMLTELKELGLLKDDGSLVFPVDLLPEAKPAGQTQTKKET